MRVKGKELKEILNDYVMSNTELAREMGVDVAEVEKLLYGESVGLETATKFIKYFGSYVAGRLINWNAVGKKGIIPKGENLK